MKLFSLHRPPEARQDLSLINLYMKGLAQNINIKIANITIILFFIFDIFLPNIINTKIAHTIEQNENPKPSNAPYILYSLLVVDSPRASNIPDIV
jgi:hypothetical protein